MNAPATLTPAATAALQALAASPEAARALADREAERARQRADALRRLADEQKAARAQIAAVVPEVQAAAAEVARLRGMLRGAQIAQAEAEQREFYASLALERIVGAAEAKLAPLGGEVIDSTLRLVLFAQRVQRGAMEWRDIKNPYGSVTDVVPTSQEPARRLEWLRDLQRELEGLRLDPRPPAEIERRCAAIQEAIEQHETPQPTTETRLRGLGFFKRAMGRFGP